MKLFLCSQAILPSHYSAFENLVGKKLKDTKLALIEDAADGEDGEKQWVIDCRNVITNTGMQLTLVKLKDYINKTNELKEELQQYDVVYFGGGSCYYLRWIMQKVGLVEFLPELLNNGTVYAGASAGACVTGPTLKYLEEADCDNKNAAETLIEDGLSFIDTIIIPHWERPDFAEPIALWEKLLQEDGYKTQRLTDEQALVVNDKTWTVIP